MLKLPKTREDFQGMYGRYPGLSIYCDQLEDLLHATQEDFEKVAKTIRGGVMFRVLEETQQILPNGERIKFTPGVYKILKEEDSI